MPATARLAEAPISVPLPPRQAPSESAHHSGITCSAPPRCGAISLISGTIAATNGMLSTIAERNAKPHRMTTAVTNRCPSRDFAELRPLALCAIAVTSARAVSPDHLRRRPKARSIRSPSAKLCLPSDDVDRMAALLHHQLGGVHAQTLDRPGPRLARFSARNARLNWRGLGVPLRRALQPSATYRDYDSHMPVRSRYGRIGLQLQQRRKLRLAAGAPVIDHQFPGDRPSHVRT